MNDNNLPGGLGALTTQVDDLHGEMLALTVISEVLFSRLSRLAGPNDKELIEDLSAELRSLLIVAAPELRHGSLPHGSADRSLAIAEAMIERFITAGGKGARPSCRPRSGP